jgi:hypothetical protein
LRLGPDIPLRWWLVGLLLLIAIVPVLRGQHRLNVFGSSGSGVEMRDLGVFVVMNDSPANGTSAPLSLVAGTWGDRFNFTITDGQSHIVNFWSQDLKIDVNATLSRSTVVYLELGTASLPSSFYIQTSWT